MMKRSLDAAFAIAALGLCAAFVPSFGSEGRFATPVLSRPDFFLGSPCVLSSAAAAAGGSVTAQDSIHRRRSDLR